MVADYLRLPDRHRSGLGMTAGGSLSPLLAAVMLIPLDEAMNRLSRYAERWCRWRRAGLDGLVSLKGGLKRVVIRQLKALGIVGSPIPKYDAQTCT